MKKYKIAVAGTGYVGLSIATLLSQHHHVTAVDIVPEKVEMINNRKSPIQDDYIEKYLAEKDLDLTATLDAKDAYSDPLDENNEKVLVFKKKYGLDGKFVIMYSGNIGLYYDLENLIKVVEKIKVGTKTTDGREVVFAFVGAGSVLDKLVLYVKEHHMDNVTFIPYQDKADLIYSLNAGDVHWCVNAKGIKGVSCPSKAYGIMAASKPILGVLESGSEVRCLIEDTHGGLCCEPGEYDKVEENIRWFIENAGDSELKAMGARGRENLENNLTRNVSVRKYAEEILKL